jgi:SAM-dependent MidA family methyltransferase
MSTPAQRLQKRIADRGRIPFAELMAEALYGEGGYYGREEIPIGTSGDFVTGSSLSPLFGRATAQLVRRLDEVLGRPADILEVGYGSGLHLRHLLADLGTDSDRRVMAVDRVARPLPDGIEVLANLTDLPTGSLQGLIFSYELFDALPVHRLIGTAEGGLGEIWVELGPQGEFRYADGELSDPDLMECLGPGDAGLAPGQIADVTPAWGLLYKELAGLMRRGLVVTCDYGFERPKLFDARVRRHGTLACYRRQRVHRDALSWVGEQDLTAHVDFTTLAEAGEAVGLETVAFTRQARWLLACGLFDQLQNADQANRLQAMDLLAADGMGEEIRVLVQTRDLDSESVFDLAVLGATGSGWQSS